MSRGATAINRVSAAPVYDALRAYAEKINTTIEKVCCRAGVNPNSIEIALQKGTKTIDFDIADRILCHIGAQELWYEEPLQTEYFSVRLRETTLPVFVPWAGECERCGAEIVAYGPRTFCSKRCTALARGSENAARNHPRRRGTQPPVVKLLNRRAA